MSIQDIEDHSNSDEDFMDGPEEIDDMSTTSDTASELSMQSGNIEKSEIISVNNSYSQYYSNKKITKPFLNRFEKAKILGVRSEMIANGAIALVDVPKSVTSTYEIAQLEFEKGVIPLMVKRFLPNGSFELWRLEDLLH